MNILLADFLDRLALSPEGKESVYTSTIIALVVTVVLLVAAFCIRRKDLPSYRESELETILTDAVPLLEEAMARAEDLNDQDRVTTIRELLDDIDALIDLPPACRP